LLRPWVESNDFRAELKSFAAGADAVTYLMESKYLYGASTTTRTEATSWDATQQLPEGSSPHSQEPSTGLYPEPDKFSPHNPIISLQDILILPTHLLHSNLFPSGFRATCPVHLSLLETRHSNYT
jgi:hypothetical protein